MSQTEDSIQLPDVQPGQTPGKKLRALKINIDGVDVEQEVFVLAGSGLTDPPTSKKVNEANITLNADGTVATIVFRDTVPATLFTLTFSYPDATHLNIVRS